MEEIITGASGLYGNVIRIGLMLNSTKDTVRRINRCFNDAQIRDWMRERRDE
ncbi:MAG: hypothetical protein QOJ76_1471 [Acidobacteriota bacterium]|jgi:hypothetical protein|nr:hypothetical protein [Acidobacteriota bacterium]